MSTPDLFVALDALAETDPHAHRRYRTDKSYRDAVDEHVHEARKLVDGTRAAELERLLQAPGARLRYTVDPQFRHEIQGRAIKAAIGTLEGEYPPQKAAQTEQ